jgi:DNA repair exonuclease SbcCD ATPase subunit
MSTGDRKKTEQLLKRFDEAEREAIESVMRRIGKAEAKLAASVDKVPVSLGRELESIRERLDSARRSAEDRVEEFRAKLIEGPLTEEELRARIVILEMEYASRVRLAEQGFDLLAERFEDHVSTGRHWLSDVCDQVRQAVRLDVKPVRARIGEALVERARALAERERELEELRRLRGETAPLAKRVEELELRNRELEAALAEARAEADRDAEANLDLETRSVELNRELARFKRENEALNERLARIESESDELLEQLRERTGEAAGLHRGLVEHLRDAITPLLDERLTLRNRVQTLERRVGELRESEEKAVARAEELLRRGGESDDVHSALEAALKEIEEKDEAIAGLIREVHNYREASTRFAERVKVLEEEAAEATKAGFGEESKDRLIEEKEAALAKMLQEVNERRQAASRFSQRVQALEIELAQANAELKEMRHERRGLIERFNAAASDRDLAKKHAEKADEQAAAAREALKAASEGIRKSGALELETRVIELERNLEAARAEAASGVKRVAELEAELSRRTEAAAETPVEEKTLDIDAEKAELAQRIEGKDREIAALTQRLGGSASPEKIAALEEELRKKSTALDAAQKAWVSMRKQLVAAEKKPAAAAAPPDELEAIREEARAAKAESADLKERLETERKSAKLMQKRLFEADVARDRALADTRAQWADKEEEYEELLSEKTRTVTMLKTQLETVERSWQETLARQDAERMQEIFKLRSEIQKLQWKVEELRKRGG